MWYMTEGKDSDVVLNSRVTLHRNLEDYPFSDQMTDDQAAALVEAVKAVYADGEGWSATDLAAMSEEERRATAEQHVISRALAEKKGPAVLLQNADQSLTVAVGGEDHVTITAVVSGNDLNAALAMAFEAEAKLDAALPIAFTEKFGYVTRDPSEMGTGMKASVTAHLPAAAESGWIARVAFRMSREGISLRSLDGSSLSTGVYLISNRETMGQTEEEAVREVTEAADRLVVKERELRDGIGDERKGNLAEKVRRSYGMLMYTRNLGASELVSMYSAMRMAAGMKLVDLPTRMVDEAMFTCLPHTLAAAENLDAKESLGERRAAKVRAILTEAPMHL